MASKKYYWLKLKESFFRDKKIKKLRRIAGGDTYTIIYLKMQLLSLTHEGHLLYEGVEDSFAEEIALEIDEDVDNVKVTIAFLMSNGLLIQKEENEYMLPQTIECVGKESASAERVRKHRAKKKSKELPNEEVKALPGNNAEVLHCNTEETNCNTEIEKEKEKEIEIEKELTDRQREEKEITELNPMQMERVDLLRELFVGWSVSDIQIFYISTLIRERLPFDFMDGPNGLDLKIYHELEKLILQARADNVSYIYRWLIKMIPLTDFY